MYSLIIKDLLIQKRSIYFALFYSVFFFFAFSNQAFSATAYITGGTAIVYILVQFAIKYDDKNKCEIMLNSLPVRRSHVVLAKYLSAYMFVIMGAAMIGIMGAILRIIGLPLVHRYIVFSDIFSIYISITLMISIYFPFYFKLGYVKSSYINLFMFLTLFFLPSLLLPALREFVNKSAAQDIARRLFELLSTGPSWVAYICIAALFLTIMLISLSISLRIYRHKDL
ncbi:MAG: ABC-2 transporter permease [Bacillota bacterium]